MFCVVLPEARLPSASSPPAALEVSKRLQGFQANLSQRFQDADIAGRLTRLAGELVQVEHTPQERPESTGTGRTAQEMAVTANAVRRRGTGPQSAEQPAAQTGAQQTTSSVPAERSSAAAKGREGGTETSRTVAGDAGKAGRAAVDEATAASPAAVSLAPASPVGRQVGSQPAKRSGQSKTTQLPGSSADGAAGEGVQEALRAAEAGRAEAERRAAEAEAALASLKRKARSLKASHDSLKREREAWAAAQARGWGGGGVSRAGSTCADSSTLRAHPRCSVAMTTATVLHKVCDSVSFPDTGGRVAAGRLDE